MPDGSRTISVTAGSPDPAVIQTAADILGSGGIVVFPTQCLYGIAALALDEKAVDKVFRIKQRPPDNPILILVPDRSCIQDLVLSIPEAAENLMAAFWPGNLTLIFKASPKIPPILTAGTGKIGIRVPSHPVALALVKKTGVPVTGTSANVSGRPGCSRIDRLDPDVARAASLILDAGELQGGSGSTVLDVTVFPPVLVREGTVKKEAVLRALGLQSRP